MIIRKLKLIGIWTLVNGSLAVFGFLFAAFSSNEVHPWYFNSLLETVISSLIQSSLFICMTFLFRPTKLSKGDIYIFPIFVAIMSHAVFLFNLEHQGNFWTFETSIYSISFKMMILTYTGLNAIVQSYHTIGAIDNLMILDNITFAYFYCAFIPGGYFLLVSKITTLIMSDNSDR